MKYHVGVFVAGSCNGQKVSKIITENIFFDDPLHSFVVESLS